MSHLVGVAVSAFAEPSFPMPEQAGWAKERHQWLELPSAVTSHPANPVRRPER